MPDRTGECAGRVVIEADEGVPAKSMAAARTEIESGQVGVVLVEPIGESLVFET